MYSNTRNTKTDDFEVVTRYSAKNSFDPHYSWEDYATQYMEFTDTAPTTVHAVDFLAHKLVDSGFEFLNERDEWDIHSSNTPKPGKYFTVRNGTSLLAFVVGENWKPQNGAVITASHIDSLAVAVKPTSIKDPIENFEVIGVAPYSGALSEVWWDRDLGVGGRLVIRGKKGVSTKLVRIPHPIARIATLAPHFGAPSNGPFNPETQKVPFIGLTIDGKLPEPTEEEKKSPMVGKHSLRLLRALAKEADLKVSDILEIDLYLYDTQPSTLAGLEREFLVAPRVDDKACTFASFSALLETADELVPGDALTISVAFDHEEIGSLSRAGAQGNLLESSVGRILSSSSTSPAVFWANSFLLSADVTHAVNPNFTSVYLENHKPLLNTGITLSKDPNGHMITDAVSAAFAEEVARRTNNTLQQFQIRNDSRSGGTVGPFLASKTGIRGIDLGIAQLSMHSIRATIGSKDIWLAVRFFRSFFKVWREVDNEFKVGYL